MSRVTRDELDAVLRAELERNDPAGPATTREPSDIEDLEEALRELRLWKDCRRITAARSRRRGLAARLVRGAKRLFGTLFRPVLHTTLETQAQFNERVIIALELLREEHRSEREALLREIRALRGQLEERDLARPEVRR